jgi:mitogen-activated protein kinase kinase
MSVNSAYSVSSDVWSLGLSLLEIGSGKYPYSPERFDSIFAQLNAIVHEEPPELPREKFSEEALDFVQKWYIFQLFHLMSPRM